MTMEEVEEREREEVKATTFTKIVAVRTGLRTARAEGVLP